jgi:glucan phosphoethanolaminetransferase (alkaline phosphatase superfamily)
MKKLMFWLSLIVFMFISVDVVGKILFGYEYVSLIDPLKETFNTKIIIDFIYLLLLVFFFLFSRMRFVLFILYLLTLIDFGHFYLFKTHIMPFEWGLVGFNINDIFEALKANVFMVFVLIFILMIFSYILFQFKKRYKFFEVAGIVLLIVVFFIPNKISTFQPSNKHLTIVNVLFSLDRFIYDLIFKKPLPKFKKYSYQKIDSGKPLVVFIMGESLNYKRMHLYGWDYNDTPYLDYLAKNDKNFVYKKAISYAPETTTSISSFFYNKREPQNIGVVNNKNILELAKNNGYKVYWLSMQIDRGKLLPKFVNEADISMVRTDFKRKYDDELVKKLKEINFSKKSFVILHFRANHYYYEDYTPKEFYKFPFNKKQDYHTYMVNSYMNSVLYVDKLIYDTINYLKSLNKPFVFYYTSDHGEFLGFPEEKGRYLHLYLDKLDCLVPFIYYSNKYKKDLSQTYYAHYQISKMLTRDLGYKLINPNEKEDIYYINSPVFDGRGGFIEYNISRFSDE